MRRRDGNITEIPCSWTICWLWSVLFCGITAVGHHTVRQHFPYGLLKRTTVRCCWIPSGTASSHQNRLACPAAMVKQTESVVDQAQYQPLQQHDKILVACQPFFAVTSMDIAIAVSFRSRLIEHRSLASAHVSAGRATSCLCTATKPVSPDVAFVQSRVRARQVAIHLASVATERRVYQQSSRAQARKSRTGNGLLVARPVEHDRHAPNTVQAHGQSQW